MPKAKKKPRSSIAKDFDKQKTKLGKGKKPAATNATNTSFKARSIALTQQSIVKDRSSAPTSKRNLTVEELIGQTRHYSSSVRNDALTGLKEIYFEYRSLAAKQIGIIIPNLSRLISDDDAGVRSSLQRFLSFYLPLIPHSSVVAYASTLLLHITSAMSHIYPDIRLDAVKVLDLLYPALGQEIITRDWQDALHLHQTSVSISSQAETRSGHGERVLSCYMSLLGIALNTSDSTQAPASSQVSSELSNGSRLLILQSLHTFFDTSRMKKVNNREAEETLSCPGWFWDSDFTSIPELTAFKSSLTSREEMGHHYNELKSETALAMSNMESLLGKSWGDSEIANALTSLAHNAYSELDGRYAFDQPEGNGNQNLNSDRQHLFDVLSPLLISIYLDAAPSAFSPSEISNSTTATSLSIHAQLVCAIANLSLVLWRGSTESRIGPKESLGKLLVHMTTYFPFGHNDDDRGKSEIINLNLAYCELTGLLAVVSEKQSKKQSKNIEKQLSLVQQFIVDTLTEEGSQNQIRRSILRGQTYIDLLPTIWLLLNYDKEETSCKEIIDVMLLHWTSLKTQDTTKRIATEFLGYLLMLPLQKSYIGSFRIRQASAYRSSMIEWLVQDLPKYLWELHGRDAKTSGIILQLLRIIVTQTDKLLIRDEELQKLGKLLAPFFQINHPSKGSIAGPYTRLPHDVQRIARGLLTALPNIDDSLYKAASAVGAL